MSPSLSTFMIWPRRPDYFVWSRLEQLMLAANPSGEWSDLASLRISIRQAMDSLSQLELDAAIDGFPGRCKQCYEAEGRAFENSRVRKRQPEEAPAVPDDDEGGEEAHFEGDFEGEEEEAFRSDDFDDSEGDSLSDKN